MSMHAASKAGLNASPARSQQRRSTSGRRSRMDNHVWVCRTLLTVVVSCWKQSWNSSSFAVVPAVTESPKAAISVGAALPPHRGSGSAAEPSEPHLQSWARAHAPLSVWSRSVLWCSWRGPIPVTRGMRGPSPCTGWPRRFPEHHPRSRAPPPQARADPVSP